ncbi:hypothetical protein WOLCODRAFT_152669 [Wolfiporia cocos MD-104 SS10]|uniref:Retrotransposon gag domain-containing protein n=1 Tax=Wolfiporia cocos (strain MD-104) TaxID=742152 RepID=A0A2H3K0U9_WOLCO|nr:hypothetical protein WOLCODRAFT_152669 [Wolfiporia cocos MD-104 SS10]
MSQGSRSTSPVATPGMEARGNPLGLTNTIRIARVALPIPFITLQEETNVYDEIFPPVPVGPLPESVSLPGAYGPYQQLIRDRITKIEYPSLDAAYPRLLRGIPEEEQSKLGNEVSISYNAVMEAADIAAALAEEAQRKLASRLDSRFSTLFKRQQAVRPTAPAIAGPSQQDFDALLARVLKLEQTPTPVAASVATTSFIMAPKVTAPPEFSGDGSKIAVNEWLKKCVMYFGAYPITDDRQKIIQALQHLSGSAFDYQEEKIKNAADASKSLGTWAEFEEEMLWVYRKKTEEELARKEIEGYFGPSGKKKAAANFYQYAERLRQLAKKAKTPNDTLCEKLKDTVPDKVRDGFSMMRIFGQTVPTEWEKYLDMAIEMHKEFYCEDIQGSIFEKEKKKEEKAPQGKAQSSSAPQTSQSGKTTSGGGSTKKVPEGSVLGSEWRKTKAGKSYLWAPPHKCATCGRDNCTKGGTICNWKPSITAAATTTTTSSSAKPSRTVAPRTDGKKRFVREIREYYESDDEKSATSSATTATVGAISGDTVLHIVEVDDKTPDTLDIPIIGQPIVHNIPRLAPAGSSGFFKSRM